MTGRPLPLLLVGHGTRSDAGAAEFVRFVDRLAARLAPGGTDVAGGFIELAAPPVTDAVSQLFERGHRELVAVPLVLVAAGHAKGDVPGALARERQRRPGLGFRYGRPLGPHPTLLALLEANIDAALGAAPRAGTTVVLVGRGSTDPDANAETAKVARLLEEGRGYDGVETSFISLAAPSVPRGLERARRLGARRIVVAPYFLFPGVLPDRVVAQSRAFADASGDLDVRVADLLGDCDPLADLVLERYDEAIAGDIRMNCDTCVYRVAMPGFEHRVGAWQVPHDHPHDPVHAHDRPHDHDHRHDHPHDHPHDYHHDHPHDALEHSGAAHDGNG